MTPRNDTPLVLVADDEIAAATMLRHVFEREGYDVLIVNDGTTALEVAREKLPDLILLDVQMPRMNGFEVLRQLRENKNTAAIPTIVVSAQARKPSDIAHGLNIGADDYISKPFAPQELLARARAKMRARQLEETLQQRTQELEVLLRISEELNRHLKVDELFKLVLFLTLDLLPAEWVAAVQYDKNDDSIISRVQQATADGEPYELTDEEGEMLQKIESLSFWDHNNPHLGFNNGMSMILTHGDQKLGMLIVTSNENTFERNHKLLFHGIIRQASLAIHNAHLYEIQANYALHLEETVEQRTQELRETQQLLFRSEKLASIGHLAASIAHEINNPLQPIQLNLEYLLEDIDGNAPIDRELVTMTQDSVQRISRIVRQLLEFTKSSNQTGLAEISLQETADDVLRLNERNLSRSKITIHRDYADDTPQIQANRDQIEQVLMNIILNAQAAMDAGGKLYVSIYPKDENVILEIRDTGLGIPENMLDKIFDPFVSTKPEGTGLGLFVTYGIIEKHRGQIDVKSEENAGAVFKITLPRTQSTGNLTEHNPL